MSVEMKSLIDTRGLIKGALTRIKTSVDKFQIQTDNINQLKSRLPNLQSVFQRFNDVQDQIELQDGSERQIIEREEFETKYYNIESAIRTLIDQCSINNSNTTAASQVVTQTQSTNASNVRVPMLNLPTFEGAYADWISFRDTFIALIHNNSTFTNIEKFHYLKCCLKGDSQKVIESFTLSNDNYQAAWEAVEKRYENLRIITQAHVVAIINSPPLAKNSHTGLRKLCDDISVNLAALKALKEPTEHWDTLLIPIVTLKFDFFTKREWESTLNSKPPKINELMEFLENRCLLVQSLNSSDHMTKSNNSNGNKSNSSRQCHSINKSQSLCHVSNNAPSNLIQCFNCKKSHTLFQCQEFLKFNIPDRINKVKSLKLCSNCFRNNHSVEDCKSKFNCRFCKQRHNSLLHENVANAISITAHIKNSDVKPQTLLSTAEILIKNQNSNNWIKCRALLDQGSQLNFIRKSLVDSLGLETKNVDWSVTGINNSACTANEIVKIHIKSIQSAFNCKIDCLILPKITENLPSQSFTTDHLNIPENLKLADPNYNTSSEIDILLGAEVFWEVLLTGQIKANAVNPHLQNTCLGWILGGKANIPNSQNNYRCNITLSALSNQLSKFWEVEEYPITNVSEQMLSAEEIQCERYFQDTTTRDASGRFIIRLPFKTDPSIIGNTKNTAINRLNSLEKRFSQNLALKQNYSNFIHEYIDLHHMTLIEQQNENIVYLPHHGVLKDTSTTTKLRVVFDGSAKSTSNVSLNETLSVGPKIQNDIIPILLRFRIHKYVFTADISKMYRQILVAQEDRVFQNILWRDDLSQEYQTYQLNTITYGLSCAPYLAVKCLQKLAIDSKETYPETHQVMLNDFYVDDVLTGSDSLENTIKSRDELISLLKEGGFDLRKFAANNSNLLPNSDSAKVETHMLNFDENGDTRTLGMIWNCQEDELRYEINSQINNSRKLTKRKILSAIAKIYDPLQLIGPVIVKAKLIMQSIWKIKLGWDEQVPEEITRSWNDIVIQLENLNNMRIPRRVISLSTHTHIELHGFCDSSQVAYGACVFVRVSGANLHSVHLLCAKSRVAPLKTISIPRLELCGAVLLARLMSHLKSTLNINTLYYWTDSTIVLSWLNMIPNNLKTFTANRVAEIQNISDIQNWKHVRSTDNPADVISRGVLPNNLINCSLWFHGPPWLSTHSDQWPCNSVSLDKSEIPELRKIALHVINKDDQKLNILNKYSSSSKTIRILALCLRFVNNARKNSDKQIGVLKPSEIETATLKIIKLLQNMTFGEEIQNLNNQMQVSQKSTLKMLSPFLDKNGVIRVGGRLNNSNLKFSQKFPIVLPKHHFTKLIIRNEHESQLHAGPSATLAAIRQNYWPLDGRNQVRNIIRKCVKCFHVKPMNINLKMGDLPKNRVTISRPFQNCGVDYGGPIFIKEGGKRSKKTVKVYICLFICFSTKAVHVELVGDLTAQSFLNSLKRFISRRGMIDNIYSDNATNFRGADNELKKLVQLVEGDNEMSDYLSKFNIKWHFIPSRSPHFGGIWEAGIKSVKYHIKRVIGNTLLTYEEMITLLVSVEACLNSRPLCPLSEDPADNNVLTPGHFLIGCPLSAPVEPCLQEMPTNRLSRWQHMEYMRQHFWNRWSKEYLATLQQRTKWYRNESPPVDVGALVLLKEATPPLTWKMGRILQLHRGTDGIVRVVTIKTVSGETTRAVRNICIVPVQCNETNAQ